MQIIMSLEYNILLILISSSKLNLKYIQSVIGVDIKKILLILLIIGLTGFSVYNEEYGSKEIHISDFTVFEPLDSPKILYNADYGSVIMGGPYGNRDSDVKVAYIVGVHPLEHNSHKALLEAIICRENTLKHCYYIYLVKVTRNASDYNEGRINGQLLANEYAVPDIMDKNITLVIDVHSNRGFYKEKRFVSVPVNDGSSESIAFQIINKISWLVFYIPPTEKGPTSGPYITVPLIKSGTPAMVYETYMYEPYETTLEHANDLICAVDELRF